VIRTLAHQAANQPVDSAEMEVDQVGLVVAAVACAVACAVLRPVVRAVTVLSRQSGRVLQICKSTLLFGTLHAWRLFPHAEARV
jgi:hypothetical protein